MTRSKKIHEIKFLSKEGNCTYFPKFSIEYERLYSTANNEEILRDIELNIVSLKKDIDKLFKKLSEEKQNKLFQ